MESYFGELKSYALSVLRQPLSDFLRDMLTLVKGKTKERKLPAVGARKLTEVSSMPETWRRRRTGKKPKYLHSPTAVTLLCGNASWHEDADKTDEPARVSKVAGTRALSHSQSSAMNLCLCFAHPVLIKKMSCASVMFFNQSCLKMMFTAAHDHVQPSAI